MPIATIGAIVKVTPCDELQIVRSEGIHEFIDDRSSFTLRISETMQENGVLIGVAGPVIDGHSRYQGMIATLMTRLDDSHWETDMHSAANFKVGRTIARRAPEFPHLHPQGIAIDSYPFILRYGSVDAES